MVVTTAATPLTKAEKIHFRYMQLALLQARKATEQPTNFRVGAVLIDGRKLPAGVLSDNNQQTLGTVPETPDQDMDIDLLPEQEKEEDEEDTFDVTSAILETGYTGELPGNTHAEECALEKYGRLCRGDVCENDGDDRVADLSEDEFGPTATEDNFGGTEVFAEDGPEDRPFYSSTTSPITGKPRKMSLSSVGSDIGLPFATLSPTASNITAPDLVIYTTLEPCSLRLSGREPCVSRILRAQFDEITSSAELSARKRRYSRPAIVGTDNPTTEIEMLGLTKEPEDLHSLRQRKRRVQPPQRRITHVFVGVSEPAIFVEKNSGKGTLQEEGIKYILVPGLEEQILKVAASGHSN